MEGFPNTATQFSMRPATSDDLRPLMEIEQKIHVSPWTQVGFEGELQKPYSHVYLLSDDETDSQIAGYIVFWLMFDECQILNVGVDLPYRGLGLAKKMIREAVKLALKKGIRRAVLDVRKSNMAAIQLYQGLGFNICQIRKQFYSNGEDAYQMKLDLEGEQIEF